MANPWDSDPIVKPAAGAAPWEADPVAAPAAPKGVWEKAKGVASDVVNQLSDPMKGLQAVDDIVRLGVNGLTFGVVDNIAGALTPGSTIADEHAKSKAASDRAGWAGTVAELGGGLATGMGAASKGLTLIKEGQGLAKRMGAMALEGGGYGALSGAANGDSVDDRIRGAIGGGLTGAGIGGALPAAGKLVGVAATPLTANYMAWRDPAGAAQNRVATALQRSGKSADDVAKAVTDADAAGQGVYTVADALGKQGQNEMSRVARSPGPGQTAATEFLENRQAGQGRRIASQLAVGFDAPKTAAQTEAALRAERRAAADTNYEAARDSAGAVDVSPSIALIDQQVKPGVQPLLNPGTEVGSDTVTGLLGRARGMLTNDRQQLSDFNEALLVKRDMDALIDKASPTQQRALIPVRDALDDQLAATSAPYAKARDTFREQSKAIDAIPEGQNAAMRGRPEDTIPAFQARTPEQQAAFRVGYSDPLIEAVRSAAPGANKARPLMSDAHSDEINAFAAPGRAQTLQDQLRRESDMFATRNRALGGSQTFDNAANEADGMSIIPKLFLSAHSLNPLHAISAGVRFGKDALTGNTEGVRRELGDLLMRRGSSPDLAEVLNAMQNQVAEGQRLQAGIHRGVAAGGGLMAGEAAGRGRDSKKRPEPARPAAPPPRAEAPAALPQAQQATQGAASYPSAEDAAFARRNEFSYGRPDGAYIDGNIARLFADRAGGDVAPTGTQNLYVSDVTADRPPGLASAELPSDSALRQPLADFYTRAALATNRIPVAALGFDPSKANVDASARGMNIGGAFDPGTDRMYANGVREDNAGSNLVHESVHRGLNMLRQSGKLPEALQNMEEEAIVREIMRTMAGDPEGLPVDVKQKTAARQVFESNPKLSQALAALNGVAAQEIARRRPGGPR